MNSPVIAAQARSGAVPSTRLRFRRSQPAPEAARNREIVLHASDLVRGQRECRRIRASAGDRPPVVVLEVEAVLSDTFAQARLTSVQCAPSTGLRYVGTAQGLAGLIADIAAAEVADGVNIVTDPGSGSAELVARYTVPWPYEHDLVDSTEPKDGP